MRRIASRAQPPRKSRDPTKAQPKARPGPRQGPRSGRPRGGPLRGARWRQRTPRSWPARHRGLPLRWPGARRRKWGAAALPSARGAAAAERAAPARKPPTARESPAAGKAAPAKPAPHVGVDGAPRTDAAAPSVDQDDDGNEDDERDERPHG